MRLLPSPPASAATELRRPSTAGVVRRTAAFAAVGGGKGSTPVRNAVPPNLGPLRGEYRGALVGHSARPHPDHGLRLSERRPSGNRHRDPAFGLTHGWLLKACDDPLMRQVSSISQRCDGAVPLIGFIRRAWFRVSAQSGRCRSRRVALPPGRLVAAGGRRQRRMERHRSGHAGFEGPSRLRQDGYGSARAVARRRRCLANRRWVANRLSSG